VKIAFHLHCHYEHIVPEFARCLINIPCYNCYEYTTFITFTKNISEDVIKKNFERYNYLNLKLLKVDNEGFDIKPFLEVLKIILESDYDLIFKLHTKKNDKWRKALFESLLSSHSNFNRIIEHFIFNEKVLLTGLDKCYVCGNKFIYDNKDFLNLFLNKLDFKNKTSGGWGFFAGTMFCSRVYIYTDLLKYLSRNKNLWQGPQSLVSDGSIFHALERLFGILPLINNGVTSSISVNHKGEFSINKYAEISKIPVTERF
jgi:lipopolysaccharide biosynthesis protein